MSPRIGRKPSFNHMMNKATRRTPENPQTAPPRRRTQPLSYIKEGRLPFIIRMHFRHRRALNLRNPATT
jgi:hypothetical protein